MRIIVATFNIHNDVDRYGRRRELLAAAFAGLGADVAALQEVRLAGERQDDLLMSAAPAHAYHGFHVRYQKYPEYCLVILAAANMEVLVHEQLALGEDRVAQRVLLALPQQKTLWFANTHLHHRLGEPAVRAAQAALLARWMADAPEATGAIVAGDFNAGPQDEACAVMRDAGYVSAFAAANGAEPATTRPAAALEPGEPACVDYIWLRGAVSVKRATLAATEPAPGDPTLFPSDHFALVAELDV